MNSAHLHRRTAAGAALCALIAFISGAGFDAPFALPAAVLLLLAIVWQPSPRARRMLEPVLRIGAILLLVRAAWYAIIGGVDVVAPMVDLLFLLLAAEALRGDAPATARLYALSFALLVAASAYRPSILFGAAFLGFVVLLTIALVTGHVARQAQRHGQATRIAVVPGRFVFVTAALSGVVLLTSAAVFITFPRVTRGWVAREDTPARNIVGFSDVVSIGEHGARIEGNPEVVLRVEFPESQPASFSGLHWRGRSYDRFDGVRWHRTEAGPYGLPLMRGLPADERVHQLVYARALPSNPIFGLHPIVDVQPRSRIWPVREVTGDIRYLGRAAPVYLVVSGASRPTPDALRAESTRVPRRMMQYLQLPDLPDRVGSLADSLTRGATSNYDRAIRIQHYLRTEFGYTRELPASARETSIDYFLFERRAGHCEYFSTAMVLLLRAAGVPARNVNGFLGGDWNEFGNYLAVSQNNAHSWVEVWFPEAGWVEFDPTPAGAGGSVASSADTRWFAWLDGLEHRWNKWVLDYALEDQIELLDRVREPFTADDGGADTPSVQGVPWQRVLIWSAGAAIVLMALWLVLQQWRRPGDEEPVRSYRRLRRDYAGAGFDPESTAPRAFVAALHLADAPGTSDAAAAVDLYLRGRFSAQPLGQQEHEQLRARVRAAREALRAARNAAAGNPREPGPQL